MSNTSFEDRMFAADLTNVDVTDANAIAALLELDPGETAVDLGETQSAPAVEVAQATQAAPVPEESNESPTVASENETGIAGVLTKDGKHVIPYQKLQEARTNASIAQQRAAQVEEINKTLEEEIATLKSGKLPDVVNQELEEQLEDFPALKVIHEQNKVLKAQLEQSKAAAKPASRSFDEVASAEVSAQAQIDEALAKLPVLSAYAEKGGVVWARAVEIDAELSVANPSMSLAERFSMTEVALKKELGIAEPSTPKTQAAAKAAPARPRATPTPTEVMPTLTDFTGSGISINSDDPFNGATDGQMVDKAMSMKIEDLRGMLGLS